MSDEDLEVLRTLLVRVRDGAAPLVVIESPYAGDVEANVRYGRRALRDALRRGEAPFASHLLYTHEGVLDDEVPLERELGIFAGLSWAARAEITAVYVDRGISSGMQLGIAHARALGRRIEYRYLDGEPAELRGLEAPP